MAEFFSQTYLGMGLVLVGQVLLVVVPLLLCLALFGLSFNMTNKTTVTRTSIESSFEQASLEMVKSAMRQVMHEDSVVSAHRGEFVEGGGESVGDHVCKPKTQVAFAKTHKTGSSTIQNILLR